MDKTNNTSQVRSKPRATLGDNLRAIQGSGPTWMESFKGFCLLSKEVDRQMAICGKNKPASSDATVVDLEQMGDDYYFGLAHLANILERLLSTWESGNQLGNTESPESYFFSQTEPTFCTNPQLFWQIPAFCASSLYVDAKLSKSQCMALHDPIVFSDEFWNSTKLVEWASAEESSILLVQGDYQTTEVIDQIALDLVQYLEDHFHPVAWVFNDMISSEYMVTRKDIVKQLAIQILQKNSRLLSTEYLPRMVEHFQMLSGYTDWFDALHVVLEGMPDLCIVIDLGILGSRYKTSWSWLEKFSDLFEKLQQENASILKIVLLSCWPLSDGDTQLPTIDINAQIGPPSLQRAYRGLQSEGFRSLKFPAQSLKYEAKVSQPINTSPTSYSEQCAEPSSLLEASKIIGDIAAKQVRNQPGDWFSGWKSFEKTIDASRKEPDAAHPRVKVAVLDTGLDLSHRDICKAQEQGRLSYRDFVNDSNTITDDNGHGTHCTSLILKYAPHAEVFAGRVFRRSEADGDSCRILTKAICYAAEVWKVDIISLSLGFTQDNNDDSDQLREEIRKASGNILIFASAANNTSNETNPVRFPARMTEVMCIFSSNSFGRPSDFNPGPTYNRPNLTFPGENIKGSWPSHLADDDTTGSQNATYKVQSGTSCSTPIAAAVAAGILEFAWQEREPAVRRVKQLKHYTGMTQIFIKRMVDNYKVGDNSYNYVKPWKLISTSCRKDDIPVLISDVLDNIYS